MSAIIEINQLTKCYGDRTAVKDLNLTVYEGEIFGFVGPNGAGKTSTIRMIATLLQPTSGEIRVAGHPVHSNPRAVRRAIGYMPDFFGVYHDLKVWEYLDFFAACYGIRESVRKTIIDELLDLVDLSHRRDDWVVDLSRGMKQRLCLARTLVHDPQVLILDEPASGLDPRARIEIRELLIELARLGKTIFFSTHILSDVAEISTRVGIIEAGEIVAVGALDELQQQVLARRTVQITVLDRLEEAQEILRASTGVVSAVELLAAGSNGRKTIEIEFSGDDASLSELLAGLVKQGIPVVNFSEDRKDLEEVFMRATRGVVS